MSKNNTGFINPLSKLTMSEVVKIKTSLKQGVKQSYLANKFKVSCTTISKIKRGILWTNIKI
ncbi:MAG: helix-turn-helix domain-containing protein [Bacteroidia bacterium]